VTVCFSTSLIVVEMNSFMPISNKLFMQPVAGGKRCGFIAPCWRDSPDGNASFQHRLRDL
jgi:hypothetical protein